MIREAAGSTDDRKKKIIDLLKKVTHNSSETIKGFGLQVDTKFINVPARQLAAPTIEYKNSQKAGVTRGAWRSDNLQYLKTYATSTNIDIKWSIINTDQYTSGDFNYRLKDFGKLMHSMSLKNGVRLEQEPFEICKVRPFELEQKLQEIGQEKRIKIVFCVIPNNDQNMYAKIKQNAELKFGVLTQCIKSNTIMNKGKDPSTITNLLNKVNAKLNGTNHKVQHPVILEDSDKGKVMFIGADVTHPTPGQFAVPSVVGVAATHDEDAFSYNVEYRLQEGEIIKDFRAIVTKHLQYFKAKNRQLPQKIFYYRDGVSDSQFDAVMAVERTAIMQACHDVHQGYEKTVKLTIIIVQKRHHTRLFPGKNGISTDRNNNVPPGTIVDTIIIRPNESQFYLCSHQSIQGVARPTKYCPLLDEGKHNIDDIHELTYNVSFFVCIFHKFLFSSHFYCVLFATKLNLFTC